VALGAAALRNLEAARAATIFTPPSALEATAARTFSDLVLRLRYDMARTHDPYTMPPILAEPFVDVLYTASFEDGAFQEMVRGQRAERDAAQAVVGAARAEREEALIIEMLQQDFRTGVLRNRVSWTGEQSGPTLASELAAMYMYSFPEKVRLIEDRRTALERSSRAAKYAAQDAHLAEFSGGGRVDTRIGAQLEAAYLRDRAADFSVDVAAQRKAAEETDARQRRDEEEIDAAARHWFDGQRGKATVTDFLSEDAFRQIARERLRRRRLAASGGT
jgi:hypothetical protein